MSFLANRNKSVQAANQIEEDKIMPIEVVGVEETESYLKVKFKTLLTDISAVTNLQKNNSPFSVINKFIDAANPEAESIEELIGAKLAAVFSVKHQMSYTYYNITAAFPMESALEELLGDFDQSTDSKEEVFEEEMQPVRKSDLSSNLGKKSTVPSEKLSIRKLGEKSGRAVNKAKLAPRITRQIKPHVELNAEHMLEEDDIEY